MAGCLLSVISTRCQCDLSNRNTDAASKEVMRNLRLAIIVLLCCVPAAAQQPPDSSDLLQRLLEPPFRRELQVSESQAGAIARELDEMRRAARERLQPGGPPPGGSPRPWLGDLRFQVDQRIAQILTPQQMERLRQLRLQRMGPRAILRPEMQDQLQLAPEQRQRIQFIVRHEPVAIREAMERFRGARELTPRLRDEIRRATDTVRREVDRRLMEVLSPPQRQRLAEMTGRRFEPVHGPTGDQPPGRPAGVWE